MKEMTVEEVKRVQVEILKGVDAFCRAKEIPYFLAYGTLLGAVRHKGYIPWDDDIDLVMLRADYERFLKEFNRENGCLKVMHWSMDGAYPFEFAKIADTRTLLVEETDIAYDDLGINIDCFVLDDLPEDMDGFRQLRKRIGRVERIAEIKRMLPNSRRKRSAGKAILTSVLKAAVKPVSMKWCMQTVDRISQSCHGPAESSKDGDICQPYFGDNEILEKIWFSDHTEVEFEGCHFPAPCGTDQTLTAWYGDYMQLPPEEERVTHHSYKAYRLDE